MSTRRLVCIVEGKGEVKAIPNLCARLISFLEAWEWFVDPEPIRQPRSRLVDERVPSPLRPARGEFLDKAVRLAVRSRAADGVLIIVDSDDDCPATWGSSVMEYLEYLGSSLRGAAVMAIREYEAWILHGLEQAQELSVQKIDGQRNAKGLLRRYRPGYRPNLHQLHLTRELDIQRCWARSDSFDKLVRSIVNITEASLPDRPQFYLPTL